MYETGIRARLVLKADMFRLVGGCGSKSVVSGMYMMLVSVFCSVFGKVAI